MSPLKVNSTHEKYKYAGYWPRMWAYNADLFILLVIYYLLSWLVPNDRILYLICFLVTLIYHAGFESSPWQATPGKRIQQIKVTDYNDNPISFWKALLRFNLKILSLALFYIGFIMIGTTKKKQGLHDIIINTLVQQKAE